MLMRKFGIGDDVHI